MLHVDDATAALVRRALNKAQDRGLDVVQTLDNAGLLDFDAKRRHLMSDTLRRAAQLLDESTVPQIAPAERPATTPLDMKRQVADWLRRQAAGVEGP